jgi:murein DD-endopeptidase MepM/ murein hydrolase activator NlpD
VHQGDTLSEIADRHGVTVRALAQANGIRNVNMILVGLTLTIPDQGGGSNGRGSGGDGSTGGSTGADAYIVQRGDSLESITAKTGVSAASIMAANNLTKPNQLYVGARIFLAVRNPSPNPSLARCPVPGASFGYDWGFPREGGRYHQGTDLFAPKGTPVMAPASGTVTQVIGSIGGNQVTFLADNGTTYIDSHLSRFGATGHVRAGEVIGYVGNTGSARGGPTHLHFEVHPGNGVAVNAYPVLVAACR